MNVFIYTQSYYVRNTFVNALFPKGITLYHGEKPENFMSKLVSLLPEVVVLDVIQEDYSGVFNLVKEIKGSSDESIRKAAVILLIGAIDKQYITDAIQAGVIGFIKSNAKEEFIADYIIATFQKIAGVTPARKFVRVSLDTKNPNEKIGVKFRSPLNSQLIIGAIKDISFGGIALELIGTFPPESIAANMEIRNIQFILDGKDIFLDAVVVAYQQKFVALRFIDMSSQVKESISRFIFEKISSF